MVEVFGRDLKDFGLENKNFWVIEGSLLKTFGANGLDELIKIEILKPKKIPLLNIQKFDGHLFTKMMGNRKKYYVVLTKGLYRKIEKEELEAIKGLADGN